MKAYMHSLYSSGMVHQGCRNVVESGHVEAKVVLFEGFPEGAVFGSPLHKVFFYPRFVASVADTFRLASGQDALDGGFVPRGVATP